VLGKSERLLFPDAVGPEIELGTARSRQQIAVSIVVNPDQEQETNAQRGREVQSKMEHHPPRTLGEHYDALGAGRTVFLMVTIQT